jgi:CHAT domain-containing protein/Tfp pilus assembly protein PilF
MRQKPVKNSSFILLYILLIYLYPATGFGQENTGVIREIWLHKAYEQQERSNLDSAIYNFSRAGMAFKKEGEWEKYLECIAGENRNYLRTDRIGDVETRCSEALQIIAEGKAQELDPNVIEIYNHYARFYWYAKGNFPEALKLLDKATALCEAADFDVKGHLITTNTNYGYAYGYAGDFDNSALYFKKALDQSMELYGADNAVIADRLTDMVFPLIQKSEWEKAEVALKKAIELNIKNRGPEHITVLKNYNNLGYIYLEKFDNDQAILYINKALELIRQKMGENNRSVGIGYMNLGASYFNKGEFERSIYYSKMALDNLTITVGSKNPYMGIILTNIANCYAHHNTPDSAAAYYQKALQLKLDLYGKDHLEIVRTYGYISDFYLKYHQPDKAIAAISNAKTIADKVLPPKHKITADNYAYLAEYYAATGKPEESLKASQQALIAVVPSFNEENVSTNPALDDVISTRTLIDILMRKTRTQISIYETTGNMSMLQSAQQTAAITDKAIDMLRIEYQTPFSKELLLTKSKGFYENALWIVFQLYEKTNTLEFLELAYKYIEKSKSILMFEYMKSDVELAYTFLPDSIAMEEKALSRSIELNKEKILEAKNAMDSVKLSALQNEFFQKKRDYDFLVSQIREHYPEYYELRHDITHGTVSEIQTNLDADAFLVEYFYGNQDIYILAISASAVVPRIVRKAPALEEAMHALIEGFENKQFDAAASFSIYNALLKPVLDEANIAQTQHLTFVPDGLLHYIPFEILISSDHKSNQPSYLIYDYTVNYLHTASLPELFRKENSKNLSYLGFSPGYDIESNSLLASRSARNNQIAGQLVRLPMAEMEITKSAAFWKGSTFFSKEATEQNFKQYAGNAGIIHIASHAIIDDEEPMNSRLVFSPGADTLEDGLLHTYELYNMKLNAQLACLSACNTGFGKIKGGEGVVSLAKGFFYAGVPNVMMSLWSVPDQSTSEIMTYFYEELKKGRGKADALRNAKLHYLSNSDENTSNPYYWAAFTLIGDNQPLQTSSKLPYWLFGVFSLTMFAGWFFIRNSRQKGTVV